MWVGEPFNSASPRAADGLTCCHPTQTISLCRSAQSSARQICVPSRLSHCIAWQPHMALPADQFPPALLPQDPASQLAQLVALEHLAGVALPERVRQFFQCCAVLWLPRAVLRHSGSVVRAVALLSAAAGCALCCPVLPCAAIWCSWGACRDLHAPLPSCPAASADRARHTCITPTSAPAHAPSQVREVPLVLKALYDEDIVPEPLILAWWVSFLRACFFNPALH